MKRPPARAAGPPEGPTGLCDLGAAFLDALPINVYVVDSGLRVVAWNRQRETGPIGRPRQKAVGRLLKDVLPPRGFRAALPRLREVLRHGQRQDEVVESERDGRVYRVLRLPVRREGRVTHVVSTFEDITGQRALQARLIASDRLAFLGQLVAGVAHELANPLAGIAGCAEALQSLAAAGGGAAAREARQFRDLVRGEVARCERIVRQLLDAARPRPAATADLAEVVDASLRLLDRHPAFTRVLVRARVPHGLPAAAIDPDSLKQVVIALAVNAAHAMHGGGTLNVRAGRQRGRLYLDVSDTGPGVPPALRPRIFDLYFSTDPEGTGLGLPIARSLVRSRGGELVYRPRRGGGAAFRVLLLPVRGAPP